MFKQIVLLILGQVKNFGGPATKCKGNIRHEILELGSYDNLAQHRKCSIFFKITPP